MGAKTTAFINAINKQIADMREPLTSILGVADQMVEKRELHGQLMDKIQTVSDKFMPNNQQGDNRGNAKVNPEKAALAADPEFKKLTQQIERGQQGTRRPV